LASCASKAKYDHDASDTYVENGAIFKIMYGSGPVQVESPTSLPPLPAFFGLPHASFLSPPFTTFVIIAYFEATVLTWCCPHLPMFSFWQGYFSEDDVELGGLTISQQAFAEVTDASGLGAAFAAGSFDGILG